MAWALFDTTDSYSRVVLALWGTPSGLRHTFLLPIAWTHGCIGSMEGLFFESSATTLEDMVSNNLAGIRKHDGAVIDSQAGSTLRDGTPAYRIGYSIRGGAASRYGLDVMAVLDRGSVLVTLVSEEPLTPALLDTFDGMIDSLQTSGRPTS